MIFRIIIAVTIAILVTGLIYGLFTTIGLNTGATAFIGGIVFAFVCTFGCIAAWSYGMDPDPEEEI
jgi:hypothetical protein